MRNKNMEEMIEKQITILIPKSEEERFKELTKGHNSFVFEKYYEKRNLQSLVKTESLTIQISSTKFI